jgi:hypothetical protein
MRLAALSAAVLVIGLGTALAEADRLKTRSHSATVDSIDSGATRAECDGSFQAASTWEVPKGSCSHRGTAGGRKWLASASVGFPLTRKLTAFAYCEQK